VTDPAPASTTGVVDHQQAPMAASALQAIRSRERFELKYLLSREQAAALSAEVAPYMDDDSHGAGAPYAIPEQAPQRGASSTLAIKYSLRARRTSTTGPGGRSLRAVAAATVCSRATCRARWTFPRDRARSITRTTASGG
jgi:hypothetical protein